MGNLKEFECPCCGGKIEFDSASQQMQCPYCDSTFDMAAMQDLEEDIQTQNDTSIEWADSAGSEWGEGEQQGMSVYRCQSCGGEIVAEETLGASACPYCDNPIVMTGKFAGDLRPDVVIPFKLDKEAAKAALSKHLKGKVLLPKAFKDENHIDEVKGVYVPFWLFDAKAQGRVRFKGQKVRRWEDARYEYKETSYYSLVREGRMAFEHVPVDGSSKMDDELMESVEPYHYSDTVDFKTAYLSGYLADKYDVTAEQSEARANERITNSMVQSLKDTTDGFQNVTVDSKRISLESGKAQYALYPVWLLNTTWNDQKFTFAMNGQTGKFVGNLPMDKGKFWTMALSLGVGLSVVATIVMTLIG
ncbi:MAG: hypothetical protein E7511_01485 [Ruminococcus sp.]|nr:hypothetical protein [Ruminococcus sp.]